MLPPAISTFAPAIDRLYYVVLVITGIAFFVVEIGLIWFCIKYRARPGRQAQYSVGGVTETVLQALGVRPKDAGGAVTSEPMRKAYYIHGSVAAELIWTAIPTVTVVALGIASAGLWNHIKGRNSVPKDALAFGVRAKQFEWNVTYAGADGKLGTPDDFTIRNQLHVPVGRPILVNLTAEDAIHSFFVPAFRLRQDAVPGMNIRVWFQATKTGTMELACSQLCGLGHYKMRAIVTVHTQQDYDAWLADQIAQHAQTVALR
jgi:cytochrome c oxidase subunit 2